MLTVICIFHALHAGIVTERYEFEITWPKKPTAHVIRKQCQNLKQEILCRENAEGCEK
jgi:hypothetical protein